MPGPGLFADRKKVNLFNGIWRIPSNEVDRPGSFAAHMARSVNLLMNNAVYLDDFNTLVTVAVQLARRPEADKMYLYETERKHLSAQALEQVRRFFLPPVLRFLLRSFRSVSTHSQRREKAFCRIFRGERRNAVLFIVLS